MLANVSKTLATVAQVLEHLHTALVQAGFASGMPAYRSMCALLVGQRVWSLSRDDGHLGAQFQNVAAKATAVRDILEPYTEMMKRLGAIGTLELTVPPELDGSPQHPRERIVTALRAHGRPMTVTTLAREVEMTRTHAAAVVRELIASGVIETVKAGRRTLYGIKRRSMNDPVDRTAGHAK